MEAREVVGDSGLLVRRRGERGGRLVAVGGGRRRGDVPLRGLGPVLAAFHQIGPLWQRRTPLFIGTTKKTESVRAKMIVDSVRDISGSSLHGVSLVP